LTNAASLLKDGKDNACDFFSQNNLLLSLRKRLLWVFLVWQHL